MTPRCCLLAVAPAFPLPWGRSRSRSGGGSALEGPSRVRLVLLDALGREVAVVAEGSYGPGAHAGVLDGLALAPGAYVVRAVVTTGGAVRTLTTRLTVAR